MVHKLGKNMTRQKHGAALSLEIHVLSAAVEKCPRITNSLCLLGYFSRFCCRLLSFQHYLSGTQSKCKMV